ncbi:MAG: guanylate kinase [Puniceicoccales bacterium]|nr:guanylate kinase [Puniceicoccales bacterium]
MARKICSEHGGGNPLCGILFIISGPSGVGKNTVAERLLGEIGSENLKKIITTTTRHPRIFEKNGTDYNFISGTEFAEKVRRSEFLEYANVHGDAYYGSPRSAVEKILFSGANALLVVDTSGVVQILSQKHDFKIVTIFIAPKSLSDLRQRIVARGTETEVTIARRMQTAEHELKMAQIYNYAVTSGSCEEDFLAILKIYNREIRNDLPGG